MGLVGRQEWHMAAAHRGAVKKVQYFAYHPRSPYSVIPGAVSQIRCSAPAARCPRCTTARLLAVARGAPARCLPMSGRGVACVAMHDGLVASPCLA